MTKNTWLFVGFLLVALLCISTRMSFAEPEAAQLRWTALSKNKHFNIDFYPEENNIRLSVYQNWIIEVTSVDGKPVSDLALAITGGMPQHKHGLPSQPKITRYLGEGRYLVKGIKFTMYGHWLFIIGVNGTTQSDQVKLDVILEY